MRFKHYYWVEWILRDLKIRPRDNIDLKGNQSRAPKNDVDLAHDNSNNEIIFLAVTTRWLISNEQTTFVHDCCVTALHDRRVWQC